MSWLAIPLALVALPLALLDRRASAIVLALAVAAIIFDALKDKRPRVRVVAAACAAIAAIVLGWSVAAILKPPAGTKIDSEPYARTAEGSRTVLLPFTVSVYDITKLALLEFEPDSDSIYEGFEPQFIERDHEQGYRVIGYRHDGYVDIYDDTALTPEPDLSSQVTGKGLLHYKHTPLEGATIARDDEGRAQIAMAFTDEASRRVVIDVREGTKRKSVPFNLLAPVGWSSTEPDIFPLLVMNDFEFLRTQDASFDIRIDGKPCELAGFPAPMPMQGQVRSFGKYSLDAEIIEVFPTTKTAPGFVATEAGSNRVEIDGVTYLFDGDRIERIRWAEHEMTFVPALDLSKSGDGELTIASYPDRGKLSGGYTVASDGASAEFGLRFTDVEPPHIRDLGQRLLVHKVLSFFSEWPKGYEYRSTINLQDGTADSEWINHTPESAEED